MSDKKNSDKNKNKAAPEIDDRFKHSIYYQQSTSEIKDDFAALAGCLKAGGGPLTRQEAAFLLWHHALQGEDSQEKIIEGGCINACLTVLESEDCTPVEKTCAGGLLAALTQPEANREAIARGKTANAPATHHLHNCLFNGGEMLCKYAATTLNLLAADPHARSLLLKTVEQQLPWSKYRDLLANCPEPAMVMAMASFCKNVLHGRDDLKDEASRCGLVEALLSVIRRFKSEVAVGAAVCCLQELAEEKENWGRIINDGGLSNLVDLLGPPPPNVVKYEKEKYRHLLEPEAVERERQEAERAEREKAKAERDKARTDKEGEKVLTESRSSRVLQGQPSKKGLKTSSGKDDASESTATTPTRPTRPPLPLQSHSRATSPGMERLEINPALHDRIGTAAPALPSEPPPPVLVSKSSVSLSWYAPCVTLATHNATAACLYFLSQRPDVVLMLSQRYTTSRLVPLMKMIMAMVEAGTPGKKKPKKKKGLALEQDQVEVLTNYLGVLKFLSVHNTARYRIAKLGAVPIIIKLYSEADQHLLLRRNAQVLLSNLAMLAENGQFLLDAHLPEEFLVQVPMRLSADEVEELLIEFPDAPLKKPDNPSLGLKSGEEPSKHEPARK